MIRWVSTGVPNVVLGPGCNVPSVLSTRSLSGSLPDLSPSDYRPHQLQGRENLFLISSLRYLQHLKQAVTITSAHSLSLLKFLQCSLRYFFLNCSSVFETRTNPCQMLSAMEKDEQRKMIPFSSSRSRMYQTIQADHQFGTDRRWELLMQSGVRLAVGAVDTERQHQLKKGLNKLMEENFNVLLNTKRQLKLRKTQTH